jgi:hypothetical protein
VKLFQYFGTKAGMAKLYPAPIYDTIIEPFAGAAGYSCRYYKHRVILYEKDPVVYSVLDYLIHASAEEILALPLLPLRGCVDDLDVPPAARALIGFAVKHASRPGKRFTSIGRGHIQRSPREASEYWGKAYRQSIATVVEKIKHWTVFNYSWEDIPVRRIDRTWGPCTWFIDPPYQEAGKAYKYGAKDIDFARLAKWCRSLPGQVIVCENEGADWLPFQVLRRIHGLRKKSVEVIWTKGCKTYPTLMGKDHA